MTLPFSSRARGIRRISALIVQRMIHHNANRGCRQEPVGMQGFRGNAFHHRVNLQQDRFAAGGFPKAERGISRFAPEEQVECATDQRVVAGQESEILPAQSPFPAEGDAHSRLRQGGKCLGAQIAGTQQVTPVAEFLHMHSEVIQEIEQVLFKLEIAIELANLPDCLFRFSLFAGVQFQQAIVTALQFLCHLGMLLPGALNELIQPCGIKIFAESSEIVSELPRQFSGSMRNFPKRIQPFVIPPREDFRFGALQVRNVNSYGGGLADSIQPANPLFEKFRVRRQIEQHKILDELEIATLAADLRADQNPGAVLLRKECRVPIALEQGKSFVEQPAGDLYLTQQILLDLFRHRGRSADQQYLPVPRGLQQTCQPF